ncbi:hypothetical protein ACFQ9X_27510 [Catenulispora yoronensis]
MTYTRTTTTTLWVDPRTSRITDLRWTDSTRATFVGTPVGDVPLDKPVAAADHALPAATAQAAAAALATTSPPWSAGTAS